METKVSGWRFLPKDKCPDSRRWRSPKSHPNLMITTAFLDTIMIDGEIWEHPCRNQRRMGVDVLQTLAEQELARRLARAAK